MSIIDAYDPDRRAVLEATDFYEPVEDFPETVVMFYSIDPVNIGRDLYGGKVISNFSQGEKVPVYVTEYEGKRIGFYKTIVGAAGSVMFMEECIAKGAKKLVACGSCGTLDRDIPAMEFIVPTRAYRDEGTSYHYAPPSDYIEVHTAKKTAEILDSLGIPYIESPVWTTDGLYRETREKIRKRREEGCRVVDMECSALMAVSVFRDVPVYQFFFGEDNLDADVWDPRVLGKIPGDSRELHFNIAMKIAARV